MLISITDFYIIDINQNGGKTNNNENQLFFLISYTVINNYYCCPPYLLFKGITLTVIDRSSLFDCRFNYDIKTMDFLVYIVTG